MAVEQPRAGTLFAVVGPSGVGKDSVIDHARKALAGDARVLFVRRVISRPAQAGSEDHDAVTPAEFEAQAAQGRFCVTWLAHGLHYGWPTDVRTHVEQGGLAIANGSRKALDRIQACFARTEIVEITATPDVIAQRLAARGREDTAGIAARMKRSVGSYHGAETATMIDNSGPLAIAGDAFVRLVMERLETPGARRASF